MGTRVKVTNASHHASATAPPALKIDAGDNHFRGFLDHLPDAAFEVSLAGTILWLNDKVEDLIGYSREELIGKPFGDLIAPESLAEVAQQLERLATGMSVASELTVIHRSGARIEISVNSGPILVDGQVAGLYGVARDITEQRRLNRRIAEQSARFRVLADCSAAFAATLDLETVFSTVASRVNDVLGDVCILRLLSDDREWLEPVATAARDTTIAERFEPLSTKSVHVSERIIGVVARTHEPVLLTEMNVPDIRARFDPGYTPRLQDELARSLLIVPMLVRGETIGTIAVISVTPDLRYTLEDQTFLQDLADRAAQAVDNARLHRKTQEAEVRYRALVEHLPAMTYIGARDNHLMPDVYMSPQISDILGYTVGEYMADPDLWGRSVHLDDQPRVEAHVRQAIRDESPIDIEYRIFRRDGELRWLHNRASIAIQNGQPLWWQGIVFDITDRKRAEEALKQSEQRFRAASEASFDAVVIIQAVRNNAGEVIDFRFVEANTRAGVLLQRAVNEIIGATMRDFYNPASAMDYIETYSSVLQSGVPMQEEYILKDAEGHPRWYQQQTVPMPGDLLALTVHDITQRRETDSALREAETRYRTLVEYIPAVTFISSVHRPELVIYISPQIEEMLGYPVEQWLMEPELWSQLIHPDDYDKSELENVRTNVSYEAMDIEYRMIARDGRVVCVRNEAVPVRDADGTPIYWLGLLTDITSQRQAAHEIEFQAQLLGAVGQAVIAVDMNNRIIYWNRAAEVMYGWTSDEVIGTDSGIIVPRKQIKR